MATQIRRPNADGSSSDWTGFEFGRIDDPVEQPAAGDGTRARADKNDDSDLCSWNLQLITLVDITNIRVWAYLLDQSISEDGTIDVNVNGLRS